MLDDFPGNLKEFIARHIESVAQMEALITLRHDRERRWTSEEVASQLYITKDMCESMLSGLERDGFLVRETNANVTYRYQPSDDSVDETIAQLADIYHERSVAVVTQIYSRPIDKVKTFADAFRLRRME